MSARQAYIEKIERHMKAWRVTLEQLKARVLEASIGERVEYERQITDLKVGTAAVEEELVKLLASSDEIWPALRGAADKAVREMDDIIAVISPKPE